MAKDKMKFATCDICGLQESAEDQEALDEAMQLHMREAHNLSYTSNNLGAEVKSTDQDGAVEMTNVPMPPQAPVTGSSANIPGAGSDLGGAERY